MQLSPSSLSTVFSRVGAASGWSRMVQDGQTAVRRSRDLWGVARTCQDMPGCARTCQSMPECSRVFPRYPRARTVQVPLELYPASQGSERGLEALSAAQETVGEAPEPCTPERVRNGYLPLELCLIENHVKSLFGLYWSILYIYFIFYVFFCEFVNRKCSHFGFFRCQHPVSHVGPLMSHPVSHVGIQMSTSCQPCWKFIFKVFCNFNLAWLWEFQTKLKYVWYSPIYSFSP